MCILEELVEYKQQQIKDIYDFELVLILLLPSMEIKRNQYVTKFHEIFSLV